MNTPEGTDEMGALDTLLVPACQRCRMPNTVIDGRYKCLSCEATPTAVASQIEAPNCPVCGHAAVRNGACFKCFNCGESIGCS